MPGFDAWEDELFDRYNGEGPEYDDEEDYYMSRLYDDYTTETR